MKIRIVDIFIIFLFITGIAIIFYPKITSYMAEQELEKSIIAFGEVATDFANNMEDSKTDESKVSQKLYSDMLTYNEEIFRNGQTNLKDPFGAETAAFDLTEYGFDNNVVGYIGIPQMDVELPIYLGATHENLTKGAVNLGYTSIPIGGTNTNMVLAAHRGYQGTAMFREIEALKIGDCIYITNLWETLTYQVVETKVILPTDIHEVYIQEGRDLVTLITCHPYTMNYQRYVVYCERLEPQTVSEADKVNEDMSGAVSSPGIKYIFKLNELSESQRVIFAEKWVPVGIAVILAIIALIRIAEWICKRRKHS